MSNQLAPSADEICAEEFNAYLAKYDDCVEAVSTSKGSKPGDMTLAELDKYRYEDAIANFSGARPEKQMGLEDVKTLVNWKLRHGKFRPTLMKLVSSNEPDIVDKIVKDASESYRQKSDVTAALNILTKLKGIGPATASLLLAVLDPERVIFFADEAFYWLCCDGKTAPIKYNTIEYQELSERALKLCKRLGVRAVDVEKVAFVMLREQDGDRPADRATKKASISPPPKPTGKKRVSVAEKGAKKREATSSGKATANPAEKKQLPGKRKSPSGEAGTDTTERTGERRSKRLQMAKEA